MQDEKRRAEHEAKLTAATLEGLRDVDEGRTMSSEELDAWIQAYKLEHLAAWEKSRDKGKSEPDLT